MSSRKVSEIVSSKIGETITNVKNWSVLVLNVKEHGLVGDGVADDTEALQALVDLAISEERKAIAFPHGTYKVTALTDDDQVFFIGDNATFTGGYAGTIEQLGDIGVSQTEFDEHVADFTNNRCIVTNDASQAVADSTFVALGMNTEVVDGNTMHDTVTNNSRITIKKAGTYLIIASATYNSNSTGVRRLYIREGGANNVMSIFQNAVSGTQMSMNVSTVETLVVDDYIEAVAYQTSGVSLDVRGDTDFACKLSVIRLGD